METRAAATDDFADEFEARLVGMGLATGEEGVEVQLECSGDGATIDVASIEARPIHVGQGTRALSALIDMADERSVELTLRTRSRSDLIEAGTDWLIDWYEGFGFEIEEETDLVHFRREPDAASPLRHSK